jgi:hypothetical protein
LTQISGRSNSIFTDIEGIKNAAFKSLMPMKIQYYLIVALLGGLLPLTAPAATFSVSPPAISNLYSGVITLEVGGLNTGEAVGFQRYLDANANGILDDGEPLVDAFRVNDGGASIIGGITNINVAFDRNAATGAITTTLNLGVPQPLQNMVGSFVFRVLSPSNNFSPVTATFVITNATYPQSISGTIYSNGVTPLAGAVVVVLEQPAGGDEGEGQYVSGAVADATGHYQLNLKPGNYVLLPAMPGYFTDQSLAAMVALTNGMSATNDLYLTNYTATISGNVHDSGSSSPLGGVMMMMEGSGNLFAVTFTQTNGNYTAGVAPAYWRAGVDSSMLVRRAYLVPKQNVQIDTTTGSVANVSIGLPKGNALIYGTFTNTSGAPRANLNMYANDTANQYDANGATDANGNYCIAVLGGTNVWHCSPDNSDPALASYIFSSFQETNLAVGEAQLRNFTALHATNHITGFVKNAGNQPITNLNVNAHATINGVGFDGNSRTDINGAYSLTVAPGTWDMMLDCNYLASQGYFCPGMQTTNVVSADVVVNFIVSTLRVTTTTLPNGTNGVYYSRTLAASGGQTPYSWALSPGWTNLPAGLTLATNGVLSGTPTAGSGTYGFSVRATDAQNSTADQYVTLYLNPGQLQITTTSLSDGTAGQYYFEQLMATGGTYPYSWYLPGGSVGLPPGLSFATNGVISGTPATNGVFNFDVAVYVNNPYQVVTQSLSLTIAPAPLQVTTSSPLPGATQGAYYNCVLSAYGGLPPYTWSLSPYSASLPTGLTLSTNGVLSGTPSVSGTFYFSARVTDSVMTNSDGPFQLTINSSGVGPSPVVLSGPVFRSNGEFQFSFDTAAGTNYTIQYTSTLPGPWTSVLTIAGSGGPVTIIDPNATVPQRFYRLKIGQ